MLNFKCTNCLKIYQSKDDIKYCNYCGNLLITINEWSGFEDPPDWFVRGYNSFEEQLQETYDRT